MKGTKISILGTGRVGSSLAYTLVAKGTFSEIVLVDIAKDLAIGEALDIDQGVPFLHETGIRAGEYSDVEGSDIVVVTLGRARKAGQSRLELAQGNVDIIKDVMPQVTKYAPNAVYVIVSNPVDILTYAALKVTDLKPSQVIGSGTLLDSARLKSILSNKLSVASTNIHGYVIGEHGDTSFIPWSVFRMGGLDINTVLKDKIGGEALSLLDIEEEVRKSGSSVIAKKGATNYAIAAAVNYLCSCIINNTKSILPISTMLNGEYGISDVCLSIPCIVGISGVQDKMPITLTPDEEEELHASEKALKDIIKELKF